MKDRKPTTASRSSRRQILKRAAVAIAAPTIVPSSVFGVKAPSNRINVACIGVGHQGTGVLNRFLANDGVQVVAVCDVNTEGGLYKKEGDVRGREPARRQANDYYAKKSKTANYDGCDAYDDFRDVLARDDVDAVTVCTPDHWHGIITIRAAEAGKDVYCEKPLSLTIGEGRAMVEAAKKHGRVLQTGSMERSNPLNRYVCELVRSGAIGEVKNVTTHIGRNNKVSPPPGWKPMPVLKGLDYDMWLGPAPTAPYHPERCFYRFRFNYDYAGGQVTNFGAHSNDLAQWGLGTDDTGPVEIECITAEFPEAGSLFNTATDVEFRCRYASGVTLTCKSSDRMVGVKFEGTDGWIESTAYGWKATSEPARLITDRYPIGKLSFDATTAHIGNFVDCVKSRDEPVANGEIGHRSATVCHLGNAALRLGRTLQWDPGSERFVNDDEANQTLHRQMRAPWKIPG